MRRLLLPALVAALLGPSVALGGPPIRDPGGPAPAATTKPARPATGKASAGTWARAEIRLVVARGVMGKTVSSFRAGDPLTRGELNALVAALKKRPAADAGGASSPVTIAELDARLVAALGLKAAAARFQAAAHEAGLQPPARFGSEVVARLLGLRINHPAGQDELELRPGEPATRAEAAYSAARILAFDGSQVARVKAAAATFELPELSDWQRRVLSTAARLIGYPYVWGGTSGRPQTAFGVKLPGGFDCSGFVWRVFKLEPYPGGKRLGATLRGRTTFVMSGEVAAAQRVRRASLAPADLVFFGARGPRSKAREIDHMGIYVGNGWFIHSSRYGVALARISDWYKQRFAWGRRPLAEAGLEPGE